MKKLTDEEIQQLLDSKVISEPTDETVLYQKIFSELSKFPNVHVDTLAQDVVRAVQNRNERKVAIKTYVAIGISLANGFLFFSIAAFSVDKLLTLKLLSVLNNLKWVIIFLFAMVVISNASEKLISIAKHK